MLGTVLMFGLTCYFAVMLAVSGLAKLEQPEYFATILRWHRLLPEWSVSGVSRVVPGVEIVAAGVLIAGVSPVLSAGTVVSLYLCFLAVHVFLLLARRGVECGCHGATVEDRVDGASTTTALVSAGLTVLLLWLVLNVPPVPQVWHLGASVILGTAMLWLGWRTWQRIHARNQCQVPFMKREGTST